MGVDILTAKDQTALRSGMVCFRLRKENIQENTHDNVYNVIHNEGQFRVRFVHEAHWMAVRLSLHYFNTKTQVDAFCDLLLKL